MVQKITDCPTLAVESLAATDIEAGVKLTSPAAVVTEVPELGATDFSAGFCDVGAAIGLAAGLGAGFADGG